jgi:hypothetical protein
VEETVKLHTRDKRVVEATADIRRLNGGVQAAKAMAFGFGGIFLGIGSILIPIAHFVLPWLLPIGGIIIGAWHASQKAIVNWVKGTCPMCGAAFQAEGGALEDPMWVRCTACAAPLRLEVAPIKPA